MAFRYSDKTDREQILRGFDDDAVNGVYGRDVKVLANAYLRAVSSAAIRDYRAVRVVLLYYIKNFPRSWDWSGPIAVFQPFFVDKTPNPHSEDNPHSVYPPFDQEIPTAIEFHDISYLLNPLSVHQPPTISSNTAPQGQQMPTNAPNTSQKPIRSDPVYMCGLCGETGFDRGSAVPGDLKTLLRILDQGKTRQNKKGGRSVEEHMVVSHRETTFVKGMGMDVITGWNKTDPDGTKRFVPKK